MSNQLILKRITNNGNEKKYNNNLYLLSNNMEINNNKIKLVPIGEFLIDDKNPLKIKCRIKGLSQKYMKQNIKIAKMNNILKDYQNFRLNSYNYNKRIDSSVLPNACQINELNKLNKFANTNMERAKIILPKINHKKSLPKEMSYVFRRNLKEIKLNNLFLKEKNFDNYNDDIIKKRKIHNVNSEWNLISRKEKNDFEDVILEDMALSNNNSKLSDVKHEKTNSSSAEKYKNGSQKLKELRKQKLIEYNKLIKKFAIESENKKKVLKEYLELMKKNFENNEEFNTKI